MSVSLNDQVELAHNAAGRAVPTMVNGKPQIPFLGAGKYQPRGRKAAPAICSNKNYSDNGDKRVADLEKTNRTSRGKINVLLSRSATRLSPLSG